MSTSTYILQVATNAVLVYTELATTVVTQVIAIPFSGSPSLLQFHLTMVAGKVEIVEHLEGSVEFIVFGEITVTWQPNVVRIKVSSVPFVPTIWS